MRIFVKPLMRCSYLYVRVPHILEPVLWCTYCCDSYRESAKNSELTMIVLVDWLAVTVTWFRWQSCCRWASASSCLSSPASLSPSSSVVNVTSQNRQTTMTSRPRTLSRAAVSVDARKSRDDSFLGVFFLPNEFFFIWNKSKGPVLATDMHQKSQYSVGYVSSKH